tara:strand:+ start:48449 stop:49111 length:663 start_codon:yes stop_codon:yes gene_type:complete
MNKKNIFVIVSLIVVAIIITMLLSSLNNNSQLVEENFQNLQNIPSSSLGVERELDGDHIISLGEPKNTIIEYASMTCPHCSDFHGDVFPKIKKDLIDTGIVKYTFRDFPLDPFAMAGTMIANCVNEDKYFDVINVLLKTQKKWIERGYQGIISVAKNFGLSEEDTKRCLSDKELINLIESNMNLASNSFGITGTPSVFVNGKKIQSLKYEDILNEIKLKD